MYLIYTKIVWRQAGELSALPDFLAEFKARALCDREGWKGEDRIKKGKGREVGRRKKGRKRRRNLLYRT